MSRSCCESNGSRNGSRNGRGSCRGSGSGSGSDSGIVCGIVRDGRRETWICHGGVGARGHHDRWGRGVVGFLLGGLNTKGIQQKGGNTRYGGYGDGADGGG